MYLTSEEFNQLCIDCQVEAKITAFPNPGNIMRAMRRVLFTNYSDKTVVVRQQNDRQQLHYIPANGTIEFMMSPGEDLPIIEKAA